MAVVSRRFEVCDVCRDPDRPVVERVRIAKERENMRLLAVCEEHADPVRTALEYSRKARVIRKTTTPSKVVTLDEIEAVKKVRQAR